MTTQYYTAATLDGFIATSDHSIDWLNALGDPEESSYPAFIANVGALAMGASTYEWMLRNGLSPDADTAGAWPYAQPTWVFTHRTLPTVEGADIRFVAGAVRPVHEQMQAAAAGKNIWLVGGGDLVGQFYDAGLLDELIVTMGSATLGSGQPLLPRAITHPTLLLQSARALGANFAELRYAVVRSGA
jgi:dihydrofolate reductase